MQSLSTQGLLNLGAMTLWDTQFSAAEGCPAHVGLAHQYPWPQEQNHLSLSWENQTCVQISSNVTWGERPRIS